MITTAEILARLDAAIAELLEKELEILQRQLSELNLNGSLAGYLKPYFPEYRVDPEYNGDIQKIHDRKEIAIAKNRLKELGFSINHNDLYRLIPDIIVHTRNTNADNLLVLEIKKDSNSAKDITFDHLKLEHMTIDYQGNHYQYRLGAAITLGTRANAGKVDITFFQDGISKKRDELI